MNLVEDPHEVEAVIGIFYFRALDRVIGVFPLLNRMLLGPDDNLVSTYFAVAGPWGDPRARIIPSKSIASGPGSFVLEGLPSFVRGGLSTLERLFSASGAAPRRGATQPPEQHAVKIRVRSRTKVVSRAGAARAVRAAQRRGERVVFTNGCFDLLHVGHVRSLEQARALRRSPRRRGEHGRQRARATRDPAARSCPARQRAEVLAALACVDWVVLFGESTPLATIRGAATRTCSPRAATGRSTRSWVAPRSRAGAAAWCDCARFPACAPRSSSNGRESGADREGAKLPSCRKRTTSARR